MFKIKGNKIIMTEGDYGIPLPITITGGEILSNHFIKFYIQKPDAYEILSKEFTNIQNNTIELKLSKEESLKLKNGVYLYGIDWYSEESFLGNIIKDEIFEVEKNHIAGIYPEETIKLQIKSATPSNEEQIVTFDEGFDGLKEVVISGDKNLTSENIKEGVSIFGVDGSYALELEDLTINPSKEQQIFNHQESDGYDNVIVNPIPSEYVIATGTLEVTENGEYDVLEKEKVNVSVDNINEYIITESYSNNDIIRRIKKLPMIDLSGNTSISSICSTMHALLEVPAWDTSTITNATSAYSNCSRLVKISLQDFSNVNAISGLLSNDRALTTLGGFKDLGKAYSTSMSANYSSYTLDLSPCTLLTHESLMNVINNLYDIASKGCNAQSLKLGSTNIAKLTEEEIAIATNKGWTVS